MHLNVYKPHFNIFGIFGHFSQINICTMEDLDSFHEQILGVPLLLRIWVAFARNDYIGESQPKFTFESKAPMFISIAPIIAYVHQSIVKLISSISHAFHMSSVMLQRIWHCWSTHLIPWYDHSWKERWRKQEWTCTRDPCFVFKYEQLFTSKQTQWIIN